MSNRSWFFASQGKQQGPYPETQLRAFIANGTVTAETLVWSEGMSDWQKAGDIPGLLSDAPRPSTLAYPGVTRTRGSSYPDEPLADVASLRIFRPDFLERHFAMQFQILGDEDFT